MKLLRDEVITETDGGVTVTLKPINTITQASLMSHSGSALSSAIYALKNIISDLTVDGVSYDTIEVSERADLSDSDTQKVLITIGEIIDRVCFLSATEKKTPKT